MDETTTAKLAIQEVVNGWVIWSDSGDWERFATVWHDDAWMTATWFQGPAIEFQRARRAGFERPILHGLCTWGIAGHALLAQCCDYDPSRLAQMYARFSSPVYPGESLRIEIWREGGPGELAFRATAIGRDKVVLDHGRATVRA